jgi:hemerythrin
MHVHFRGIRIVFVQGQTRTTGLLVSLIKIPMLRCMAPYSSSVDLGDAQIDADHCELQRLIDLLAFAQPAEWPELLRLLRDHASRHFALEDGELREMKDGNAKCHLDEHAAVLASLQEVAEEIASAPDTMARRHMMSRLIAELKRWLPEHVQAMDAAVASFRAKRRLGGVPVVLRRRLLEAQ